MKRLSQSNFFGEIALIANIPRTASIRTLEPSVFFKISADAFWEILVQHMDLGVFLETVSESRLREDLEAATPYNRTGSDS
jgi:ATP-binding cassette subfamily B protein